MSKMKIEVLDRREFLIAGGSAAALAALLSSGTLAMAAEKKDAMTVLNELTKGAKPEEGKIKLMMPEIAENVAKVRTKVLVESPMTPEDHCKSITIIAPKNPAVHVCTFHFTPDSGRAWISTNIRLAQTQEVWAVAEMSDGKFYIGKATVKVTIGGCGG